MEARIESVDNILFQGTDLSGIELHGVAEDHDRHTHMEAKVQEIVPAHLVGIWSHQC